MRRIYVWERPGWPVFRWDAAALGPAIGNARRAQGLALGAIRTIGLASQNDLMLDALTAEIVSTSAIEGVTIDAASVRSSVIKRLHLGDDTPIRDRRAEGLAELLLDATTNFAAPVRPERLFRWHSSLFASEPAPWVGRWRDDAGGAMQVVSSMPGGASRVHFEAPPAARVGGEMERLCDWIDASPGARDDGIVRSAIAHLWFLTIHPFEDGNGRIARTLADLLLARDENSPRRYISLSRRIEARKRTYYDVLEATQSGEGDITGWLRWYLEAYSEASDDTAKAVASTLVVRDYWQAHAGVALSERQREVLQRYLDGSFAGFLNARKYAKLARVSVDTAQRDLADLLAKGFIERNPGAGRNTSYDVNLAK